MYLGEWRVIATSRLSLPYRTQTGRTEMMVNLVEKGSESKPKTSLFLWNSIETMWHWHSPLKPVLMKFFKVKRNGPPCLFTKGKHFNTPSPPSQRCSPVLSYLRSNLVISESAKSAVVDRMHYVRAQTGSLGKCARAHIGQWLYIRRQQKHTAQQLSRWERGVGGCGWIGGIITYVKAHWPLWADIQWHFERQFADHSARTNTFKKSLTYHAYHNLHCLYGGIKQPKIFQVKPVIPTYRLICGRLHLNIRQAHK